MNRSRDASTVLRSEVGWGPARTAQLQPESEAPLIRVAPTGTTPEVLIPCATLYQYFWGCSSRIAKLVATGELEPQLPHRFVALGRTKNYVVLIKRHKAIAPA